MLFRDIFFSSFGNKITFQSNSVVDLLDFNPGLKQIFKPRSALKKRSHANRNEFIPTKENEIPSSEHEKLANYAFVSELCPVII